MQLSHTITLFFLLSTIAMTGKSGRIGRYTKGRRTRTNAAAATAPTAATATAAPASAVAVAAAANESRTGDDESESHAESSTEAAAVASAADESQTGDDESQSHAESNSAAADKSQTGDQSHFREQSSNDDESLRHGEEGGDNDTGRDKTANDDGENSDNASQFSRARHLHERLSLMDETQKQEVGSLLAYLQWVYENEPATLTPALLAGELAKIITGMAVTEDAIAVTVTETVDLVGFDLLKGTWC